MYSCLGVTCHLHFWQNDRGNTGVERIPNKSARKVNSEKENSPASPARIRTRDLSITSPALLPTRYLGSPASEPVGPVKERNVRISTVCSRCSQPRTVRIVCSCRLIGHNSVLHWFSAKYLLMAYRASVDFLLLQSASHCL